MSRLYRYRGTVAAMDAWDQAAHEIVLHNSSDDSKAPTRLNIYGGLAKYIYELEMTDAEERYLDADYVYDWNLTLVRIEIPSNVPSIPAKIIAQQELPECGIVIFGPQEYIETPEPEPMSKEQHLGWLKWKNENCG